MYTKFKKAQKRISIILSVLLALGLIFYLTFVNFNLTMYGGLL